MPLLRARSEVSAGKQASRLPLLVLLCGTLLFLGLQALRSRDSSLHSVAALQASQGRSNSSILHDEPRQLEANRFGWDGDVEEDPQEGGEAEIGDDRQAAKERLEMRMRERFGEMLDLPRREQSPLRAAGGLGNATATVGASRTGSIRAAAIPSDGLLPSGQQPPGKKHQKRAKKRAAATKAEGPLSSAAEEDDEIHAWVLDLFNGRSQGGQSGSSGIDGLMNSMLGNDQEEAATASRIIPQEPNPTWRYFSTPAYDATRRRCLGAIRPWNPHIKPPPSLRPRRSGPYRRLLQMVKAAPEEVQPNMHFISRRRLHIARVSTTLSGYCKDREKLLRETTANATLTPAQRALVACLKSDEGCLSADPAIIAAVVATLPGIQAISAGRSDSCHLTTRSGPCSALAKNPESGDPKSYLRQAGRDLATRFRAASDLNLKQIATCAVVSNGPLVKVAENGEAIDAHEAVWRFNLMSNQRQSQWAGTKTTGRVFNRLRGIEAAGLRTSEGRGTDRLKNTKGEQWLFWNSASVVYLPEVKRRYPNVELGLLHSSLISWMVKVYFQLRSDLGRLGLGGYSCPENLSSGIHSILLATQVCQQTNLFGFSYSADVLRTRPGHMDKGHTMHSAHSWDFDVLLVRLLQLAGHLTVCTADDPSIDLKSLRGRGSTADTRQQAAR
mmetsp:Transcript_2696/g.7633  ORF Transcript_2696/g.7633 Transcript_2696/m.7633 type:complete len:670 (+) Transcript_2696:228-2237(+)|eukprot:CAMPEP_0117667160 /NCGR_PEP_ID=MMETSP0804-20121206/10799_1 /TAXON_ID=1074897 /ORGANISM="Tetraselmis astigmatica, Strain CCMP880" /LENGTH=669 /DNA_ID=CAMNT_0005474829 /DNA_START=320 /DNA_END=2329 /DNA_ORIENTATION=+